MGSVGYQAICARFFFQTFNPLIFLTLGLLDENNQLALGGGWKFPGLQIAGERFARLWITSSFFLTLQV